MPKLAKPLGALAVKKLKGAGLHAVGVVAGLYLSISATGTRSWILRTQIGSKRSDIGLGSYPAVTLASAHEKAQATKASIKLGANPIAERRASRSIIEWTFKRCSEEYIKLHRSGWKNAKHAQQWENTLDTYAYPVMGNRHVRDIGVGDVLAIIEPHWSTKNETMVRLRNRIELVLAWAAGREYRSKENPAAWRGNLDAILPKPSKVNKRTAHKALPFAQMHDFMSALRLSEGMSAKCLEWLIMTATRSNEARGAQWSEIDEKTSSWTIPASRMKGGREHRIPLSKTALELLKTIPKFEGNDNIFQGRGDKPLSDMSMTLQMRRMKVDAVPHGFRSTFIDWAAECTNYAPELREMSLAHTLGDKTQAAYQRGDLFERRRALMVDWAGFIDAKPQNNVSGIKLAVNLVGGSAFAECLEALNDFGRLAVVGYVDGQMLTGLDLEPVHGKRLQIFGLSNAPLSTAMRALAQRGFEREVMPAIIDGRIVPVIDRTFSFDELPAAKQYVEQNTLLGKVAIRFA